mmetsp:Transcript_70678/g.188455  ORF Transcript_70678/g.188455 Transcript_70678/m.188455 type:complete len:237 (+) Transcript_70678:856-1566(+)
MEIRIDFTTSLATSSEPQISASCGCPSSMPYPDLSRICIAALAKMTLSVTIFPSSGKCHEYHSLTRIAKVFKFLSIASSNAIALMIGLSCLFGSSWSLLRLYECANPTCAAPSSVSVSAFTILPKCTRHALSSSRIESVVAATGNFSDKARPNSTSYTPSWYEPLPFFADGRLVSNMFINVSVGSPATIALICSRASSAVANGWKATNLTAFVKTLASSNSSSFARPSNSFLKINA